MALEEPYPRRQATSAVLDIRCMLTERERHRRGDRADQGDDHLQGAAARRPAPARGRPRRAARALAQFAARGGACAQPRPDPRRAPGRRHVCHEPRRLPAARRAVVRDRAAPGPQHARPARGAATARGRCGRTRGPAEHTRAGGRAPRPDRRHAGVRGRRRVRRERPGLPPHGRRGGRQRRPVEAAREPFRAHDPRPDLAWDHRGRRDRPHDRRAPGDLRRDRARGAPSSPAPG